MKKRKSCTEKPDLELLPKLNTIGAVALKSYSKELLRIFLAPALYTQHILGTNGRWRKAALEEGRLR